jgi:SAM-dependent methyltransferase
VSTTELSGGEQVTFTYEPPRDVRDIGECAFYHYMDMPGVGVVGDHWDLRKTIDKYFGGFDFRGKRALDVGAASGYLTFEMEKRGATVVSFDLADGGDWDCVPFAHPSFVMGHLVRDLRWHINRIKNAYWYAHRALSSKAQVFYGDIYDFPVDLGTFDVVMFGMVLPHLRDPFRALQSAARLSSKCVIITQQCLKRAEPVALFQPDPATRSDAITWWLMSEGCVERMLGVLGFEVVALTRAKHDCPVRKHAEECSTFVARRVKAQI